MLKPSYLAIKNLGLTLAVTLPALVACSSDSDDAQPTAPVSNIVELAAVTENLSTLASLITDLELTEALSGEGPFTVFAPTNEAFAAIEDVVASLTSEQVKDILTYHVVAGSSIASTDLAAEQATDTLLEGAQLFITADENGVVVNGGVGGSVIAANVAATNGIVHVIDKVLLPDSYLTVVGIAQKRYAFSSLVGAVVEADLAETLSGEGPFTVFAPTNGAFAELAEELGDDFPSGSALADVLLFHVVNGKVLSTGLSNNLVVQPLLEGASFTAKIAGGAVTLESAADDDANVTSVDIEGTNGVVHVIDHVLLP